MAPTSKGSPSTGSTTRTSVRRLRTGARRPSDTGLRWRTMAIAAGTSRGSREKRKPSASTPPADAPIVMMLRRIRSVLITSRPPSCGYGSLRRPLPPRGCCRWRTAGPPPVPRTAIPAPGGESLTPSSLPEVVQDLDELFEGDDGAPQPCLDLLFLADEKVSHRKRVTDA